MLYWEVEDPPLKVFSLTVIVLSFLNDTLKPAMGLNPLKDGLVHLRRRLASVGSSTLRLVGGSGGTIGKREEGGEGRQTDRQTDRQRERERERERENGENEDKG